MVGMHLLVAGCPEMREQRGSTLETAPETCHASESQKTCPGCAKLTGSPTFGRT